MSDQQSTTFDEALLSGYLDGELTQAQAQRVRIQLEDDPSARALLEELRQMRQATISTRFPVPDDDQWDERPRGLASRLSRYFGLGTMAIWLVAIAVFALWEMARSSGHWGGALFVFGGMAGLGLVTLSVILDRLRTLKSDRYRKVQK